jgi:hypothetical protein
MRGTNEEERKKASLIVNKTMAPNEPIVFHNGNKIVGANESNGAEPIS